jgi:hypothetical protein
MKSGQMIMAKNTFASIQTALGDLGTNEPGRADKPRIAGASSPRENLIGPDAPCCRGCADPRPCEPKGKILGELHTQPG